jgi:hypothetical protein
MGDLGAIGSRSPEAGGSKGRTDHGQTSQEKLRDHLSHVDSYTQRKVAEIQAVAGTGQVTIAGILDIMRELVRAATTNPLIGAVVAVIFADLLAQLKVIQPGTRNIIFGFAGVGFGVEVATELITAADGFLDALDPFKSGSSGGNSSNAGVMTPSAQTVVFGNQLPAGAARGVLPAGPPAGALGEVAAIV